MFWTTRDTSYRETPENDATRGAHSLSSVRHAQGKARPAIVFQRSVSAQSPSVNWLERNVACGNFGPYGTNV
jgi:hypothetical protein